MLRGRAVFLPAGDDDVSLLVLLDRETQSLAEEGQLNLVVPGAANSLQNASTRSKWGFFVSAKRRTGGSKRAEDAFAISHDAVVNQEGRDR